MVIDTQLAVCIFKAVEIYIFRCGRAQKKGEDERRGEERKIQYVTLENRE